MEQLGILALIVEGSQLSFLLGQQVIDPSLLSCCPDVRFQICPGPYPLVIYQKGELGQVCPSLAVEKIKLLMELSGSTGIQFSLQFREGWLGRLLGGPGL